jgi:hypothetical protein
MENSYELIGRKAENIDRLIKAIYVLDENSKAGYATLNFDDIAQLIYAIRSENDQIRRIAEKNQQ